MHKAFLTKTECELIKGSDKIISTIGGGFPSMENGTLVQISIEENKETTNLQNVLLIFDVSGWKESVQFHKLGNVCNDEKESNLISLRFEGAREVHLNLSRPDRSIDMYFCNTEEGAELYRDGYPGSARELPRPYNCFYLANRQVVIEFFEHECKISAEIERCDCQSTLIH